jgi:hypothetical protein
MNVGKGGRFEERDVLVVFDFTVRGKKDSSNQAPRATRICPSMIHETNRVRSSRFILVAATGLLQTRRLSAAFFASVRPAASV